MTNRPALTVLASGTGTNLSTIIDATTSGHLNAEVVAVFINRRNARARHHAERAGIPVHYRPLSHYSNRHRYDADLAAAVAATAPDLVVLAGWMHLFSLAFLKCFPGRVINLHPALPGQFPGVSAIADAWEAFKAGKISRTGVMVHYVPDEGVDNGPVVASAEVPIHPGDTFEALCHKIHATEHKLIVAAIAEALAHQSASGCEVSSPTT